MRSLQNFLLALVSVLAALLLLEGGVRVMARLGGGQPDPVQSEPHLYDAFRTHRLNPAFNTPANTEGRRIHSADGLRRDTPLAPVKPAGTVRILMLGGSALYGIGAGAPYPAHRYLRNDETVPARLEALLNARLAAEGRPQRVEVVNCGVIAYQTFQHLVYLNEDLLKYRPDIVVNFDGNNDFYFRGPGVDPWRDYRYGAATLIERVNERGPGVAFHLLCRWLARYSVLAGQLEKRVTSRFVEAPAQQTGAPSPGAATCDPSGPDFAACLEETARHSFLRALWQINRLGQLEGYDHLVFLQPQAALEDPGALSPGDAAVRRTTLENYAPGQQEHMRAARALFPALFRKYGIDFHDVAAIGGGKPGAADYYLDYCHLTPAGAERTAELMLPAMERAVARRLARGAARP